MDKSGYDKHDKYGKYRYKAPGSVPTLDRLVRHWMRGSWRERSEDGLQEASFYRCCKVLQVRESHSEGLLLLDAGTFSNGSGL